MHTPLFRFLRYTCLVVAFSCGLQACSEKAAHDSLASAKAYLDKGDLAAGIIELKNALQENPDLAEARFLLGKTLLSRDDPVGAEVELRKANALQYPADLVTPLQAKALLRQRASRKVIELDAASQLSEPDAVASMKTTVAQAQAAEGHLEKADAALTLALEAKPDYPPALLARARLLAAQAKLDVAIKMVDDVIAKNPADVDALLLKGDLLVVGRNDTVGAMEYYKKALAVDPENFDAAKALVMLQLDANDLDGARVQLESLKKTRAQHPETLFYRARLAAQSGDPKTADELTQQVLKFAPDDPKVLRLAGALALQRGDLVQADQHLTKLVGLAPSFAVGRILLAQTHLGRGDPARALSVLEPLLEGSSRDSKVFALAGTANMIAGDMKKAEALLRKAVQLDPTNVKSRTSLAVASLRLGSVEKSLAELEAIARSDSSSDSDRILIVAYLNRANFDAALKAIDRLDQKQPGKPQAAHMRGQALALQGDLRGARASYEKALTADPNYFPSIDGLAALDLRENKPEAARGRFEVMLKASPKDVRPMIALAKLDERAGKPKQEVAAAFAKAIAAKPTDPYPRRVLVLYHLSQQDFKLAIVAAQEGLAALPNNEDMLGLLAAAQLAAGDANQAVSSYSKLAASRPRSAMPLVGLANAHMAAKSYDAAAQALKKAKALAPEAPAVLQADIQLDLLADRPDAALAKARAAQQRQPNAAYGFAIEGDIEFSRRNWPAAATAFRAALKREPAATILAQRLYLSLRAAGDRTKTDALAAEWMKQHPTDAKFAFFLARLSIAEKNYPLAEGQLRQVLQINPDSASALNNLAWVLSAQGKPGALESAERANQLAPNQPEFMDTLAKVLGEQGQLTRAMQLQKKAVELNPTAYDMRLSLARLYLRSGDKGSARSELDTLSKLGDKFPRQAEVQELLAQR